MKKSICFVTSSRAEYGATRWLIDIIDKSEIFDLQILVTGSHLSPDFGETFHEIEKDGYKISDKVDILLSSNSKMSIVKSSGLCLLGIGEYLYKNRPDAIVVTGDRYELLPICSSALYLNIPIIHISGGDVTMGAIDNQVRNAVTMLSSIHFPVTKESSENVIRMIGNDSHVYVLGEPGLENFIKLPLWGRTELSKDLNLDIDKDWILLTCHPETRQTLSYNLDMVENIIKVLLDSDNTQIVVTKSNFDYGGMQINNYLSSISLKFPNKFKMVASLGQLRYLSLMKQVSCVIGNSSSAVIESPYLKTPSINIGNRQDGRYMCKNILSCSSEYGDIKETYARITSLDFKNTLSLTESYYGDGKSSDIFFKALTNEFCTYE